MRRVSGWTGGAGVTGGCSASGWYQIGRGCSRTGRLAGAGVWDAGWCLGPVPYGAGISSSSAPPLVPADMKLSTMRSWSHPCAGAASPCDCEGSLTGIGRGAGSEGAAGSGGAGGSGSGGGGLKARFQRLTGTAPTLPEDATEACPEVCPAGLSEDVSKADGDGAASGWVESSAGGSRSGGTRRCRHEPVSARSPSWRPRATGW